MLPDKERKGAMVQSLESRLGSSGFKVYAAAISAVVDLVEDGGKVMEAATTLMVAAVIATVMENPEWGQAIYRNEILTGSDEALGLVRHVSSRLLEEMPVSMREVA